MSKNKLIIFLKAPVPGRVKTRLAETIGAVAACAAYCRLVDTLVDNLSGLEGVELRVTPDNSGAIVERWRRPSWRVASQGAGDLGARLARAFQEQFSAGTERVAVIGSDCPEVRAADIEAAWSGLQTAEVVLGPAADGGYWLIGLRAPRPELFANISWSTSRVVQETCDRCREQRLTTQLLRELEDVDTQADWRRFVKAQR